MTGLDALFKVTRSAGLAAPKPNPQMLEEIIETFQLTPADTLMIGDSITDVEMAKQLDVDVVGVDFYHQHRAQLQAAGALQVFDDYRELARYLKLA